MPYDAVIVGSGPNGLAAAITLSRRGLKTLVLEARGTIGGGLRTAELTLPGFQHDVCSAVHPLGLGSPFFRSLPLRRYGLHFVQPPIPVAHPFDDGTALALYRDLEQTAESLGPDGPIYRRLMAPLVRDWDGLAADILGPARAPRYPLALARFGLRALWPAARLAGTIFQEPRTQALFAGLSAHSILPLERAATASFGLVLGALAHVHGWPLARGGSGQIARALAATLRALGGEIVAGLEVRSLAELPPAPLTLLDLTPRQVLRVANGVLPSGYARKLQSYRYGPGVFKMDWALSEPVPWTADLCRRAGTVHLGATMAEIAYSERAVWRGVAGERPYVIVVQPSLFDETRAPWGKHTLWAYCHVPHGSTRDMTAEIEAQIERFAPGFGDCILARHTLNTAELQAYNANYIGGDINGGAQDWRQLFTRPVARLDPYSTPVKGLTICSSSTPPGGGVHGMCGYHAARSALNSLPGNLLPRKL